MHQVQPFADRVLVKPLDRPQTTAGGIVLPDRANEEPNEGVIVAVGEGRVMEDGQVIPVRLAVGDTVIYSEYGTTKVDVDDVKHFLISESSVLATRHDAKDGRNDEFTSPDNQ